MTKSKTMRFLMFVNLLFLTMTAQATPVDNISWDATTKTLTITGTVNGIVATTNWPFTIGTETINKTDVEHLVIGDGVTEIMNGTFQNCTNLVTAIISNSVKSIGGLTSFALIFSTKNVSYLRVLRKKCLSLQPINYIVKNTSL